MKNPKYKLHTRCGMMVKTGENKNTQYNDECNMPEMNKYIFFMLHIEFIIRSYQYPMYYIKSNVRYINAVNNHHIVSND